MHGDKKQEFEDDDNLSSSIVSIDGNNIETDIDKEMTSSVITLDKSCLEQSNIRMP